MILVTGGAGYLGSHTAVELLHAGYRVLVLDNYSNSSANVSQRMLRVAASEGVADENSLVSGELIVVEGDVRDKSLLRNLFKTYAIDAVIHFAGLKSVSESVEDPVRYLDVNISGTIALLEVMDTFNCKSLVFSSSATVYAEQRSNSVTEEAALAPSNPYGFSKLAAETLCRGICSKSTEWSIIMLRYFNPVGAHPSGLIGEDPQGIPANLMPFICQVAAGAREKLLIYGDDYDTPDGTGVRDYVHVCDLARGHLAALSKLTSQIGASSINLGTGRGYSVKEVVNTFERVNNVRVQSETVARRPGDIGACFANCDLAFKLLGWKSEFSLEEMCRDAWRWQCLNPDGYN